MKLILGALAALSISSAASAAINLPVPSDLYIEVGGLDWAWAGPCAPFASASCNASGTDTLTEYQAGQGWRIPTFAEFAARPDDEAFDGRCASPYFGSGWTQCDFGDAVYNYGYVVENDFESSGSNFAETWFVRDGSGAVPEPATWALMILGFGSVGAMMRRRRLAPN